MASEAKEVVDTWTGDADPDAFTAEEEDAIIDAGLESIRKNGTVSHEEAMRRIDATLARLREDKKVAMG